MVSRDIQAKRKSQESTVPEGATTCHASAQEESTYMKRILIITIASVASLYLVHDLEQRRVKIPPCHHQASVTAQISSSTKVNRHSIQICHLTSELCERSEEHTSELQSQSNLVCRLLLEK